MRCDCERETTSSCSDQSVNFETQIWKYPLHCWWFGRNIYISNFTINPSNHLFSKTWLTNSEAKGYTLSLCWEHDRIQSLAMSFTSVSGYWNYTQLSLYSNCNSETPYSVDGILYWGPCEETLKTFWNQTKKQILPVPSWIITTVSGSDGVSALFECSGQIAYCGLARSTA
jgi:hypothetical protein